MKTAHNTLAGVYKGGAVIGALSIFVSMILGVIVIIARFLFGYSIPGHYEATQLLLALIVYFSIAYTQFTKGNVSIELIVSRVKGKKRQFIDTVNLIMSLTVICVLFLGTLNDAIKTFVAKDFQMGVLNFPLWPSKFGVAVGLFLLMTCLVLQLIEMIKGFGRSNGDAGRKSMANEDAHLI